MYHAKDVFEIEDGKFKVYRNTEFGEDSHMEFDLDDVIRAINSEQMFNLDLQRKHGGSCPCLYLETPCNERCTCIMPLSSTGCYNCCTYGSIEQRTAMAERLNNNRLI